MARGACARPGADAPGARGSRLGPGRGAALPRHEVAARLPRVPVVRIRTRAGDIRPGPRRRATRTSCLPCCPRICCSRSPPRCTSRSSSTRSSAAVGHVAARVALHAVAGAARARGGGVRVRRAVGAAAGGGTPLARGLRAHAVDPLLPGPRHRRRAHAGTGASRRRRVGRRVPGAHGLRRRGLPVAADRDPGRRLRAVARHRDALALAARGPRAHLRGGVRALRAEAAAGARRHGALPARDHRGGRAVARDAVVGPARPAADVPDQRPRRRARRLARGRHLRRHAGCGVARAGRHPRGGTPRAASARARGRLRRAVAGALPPVRALDARAAAARAVVAGDAVALDVPRRPAPGVCGGGGLGARARASGAPSHRGGGGARGPRRVDRPRHRDGGSQAARRGARLPRQSPRATRPPPS